MIERFAFQWINFLILAAGLIYVLRRPVGEFLSGRREKIRALIVRTRNNHEDAQNKYDESKAKFEQVDIDTESIKKSFIETGMFGQQAIIARARETVERIRKETDALASQKFARARESISKEVLMRAFEEAGKKLSAGTAYEDQARLLDESLTTLQQVDSSVT